MICYAILHGGHAHCDAWYQRFKIHNSLNWCRCVSLFRHEKQQGHTRAPARQPTLQPSTAAVTHFATGCAATKATAQEVRSFTKRSYWHAMYRRLRGHPKHDGIQNTHYALKSLARSARITSAASHCSGEEHFAYGSASPFHAAGCYDSVQIKLNQHNEHPHRNGLQHIAYS